MSYRENTANWQWKYFAAPDIPDVLENITGSWSILFFDLHKQAGKAEKGVGGEPIFPAQVHDSVKDPENLGIGIDKYGSVRRFHNL